MSVRVRFAPSPTGSLHIGSVRTTLYNWFFARQNKGALVLRVEDTDQDRLALGAIDSIYDGLAWLGLRWDEGPREGGPHAPYIQSQRLPLYQRHARELVAAGAAYPCFCSRERLEEMRREQQARKEITRYDGRCREIPQAEAAERAGREPHVIRLKVPHEGSVALDDLVHGHIEWELRTIDDQVLLKSDGFPTYQLAVVIDDHVMGVTHVLRGDEWLASTPKHLLVYRAFGWEVPAHAHLPSVLGPDGKKLSKRHGATQVEQFRAAGYLPEALVNYLALVGWAPGTEDEVFTQGELITRWRLDQVQRAGGKWDLERLRWFNGVHIRRLSHDELARRLRDFVPAGWDDRLLRAVVPFIQERIHTLADAKEQIEFLFVDLLAHEPGLLVPKKRGRDEAQTALSRVEVALHHLEPFDAERIETALKALATDLGWSVGDLNATVRAAVTGRKVGPPLYESIHLLGRERAIERVQGASEALDA